MRIRTLVTTAAVAVVGWFRSMQNGHHASPQTFVYREYLSSPPVMWTNVSMTFYFQEESIIFHYTGTGIHQKPVMVDGRLTPGNILNDKSNKTSCSDEYDLVVASLFDHLENIHPWFPDTTGTMCVLEWDINLHYLITRLKWGNEERKVGWSADIVPHGEVPSKLEEKWLSIFTSQR